MDKLNYSDAHKLRKRLKHTDKGLRKTIGMHTSHVKDVQKYSEEYKD